MSHSVDVMSESKSDRKSNDMMRRAHAPFYTIKLNHNMIFKDTMLIDNLNRLLDVIQTWHET